MTRAGPPRIVPCDSSSRTIPCLRCEKKQTQRRMEATFPKAIRPEREPRIPPKPIFGFERLCRASRSAP